MDKTNPRPRGGQASLSLFGLGGISSKHAPHMARSTPAPARRTTRRPWTSRIKGALNPGDRDGLQAAHYATAARASARRDEHDWSALADLAAAPEWDRHMDYGSVEAALAMD